MAKTAETPAQVKPELKDLKINKDQKDVNTAKNNNTKYTIIGILSALGVILIALSVTFTIIMKTNAAGMADKYRSSLQGVPVLKYALPKAADPDDPKNLTQDELVKKYNSLRTQNAELTSKEKDLNNQIAELLKYKADEEKRTSDAEAKLTEATALKKQADDANAKLEENKKTFDLKVANADKQAFKAFYEQVNKDTAKKIYSDIITEQKISDDTKKYVQIYEQMDTKSAGKILEQLGKSDMNLVVEILKNMSKDKVAKILPEMSTDFAASVSQKLSAVYIPK